MEHKEYEHHEDKPHAKKSEVYTIKKERIWQGIAAILGIVVIVMLFTKFGSSGNQAVPTPTQAPSPQGQQVQQPQRIEVDEGNNPSLGDKNAPVTIVSFEDYQCPYCGRAFQETFPLIKKDYIDKGKVRYVYRDFPLSFHPNAQPAAEASECANEQGKYWQYHDALFENQQSLSPTLYTQLAEQLGLDVDKFKSCFESGKYRQEVQDDFKYGTQIGVSGTPTFFINGVKLVGAQPYEAFKQIIDAELAS